MASNTETTKSKIDTWFADSAVVKHVEKQKMEKINKIIALINTGVTYEDIVNALSYVEKERIRKREAYKKNHVPSERPPGRPRKSPLPVNILSIDA